MSCLVVYAVGTVTLFILEPKIEKLCSGLAVTFHETEVSGFHARDPLTDIGPYLEYSVSSFSVLIMAVSLHQAREIPSILRARRAK